MLDLRQQSKNAQQQTITNLLSCSKMTSLPDGAAFRAYGFVTIIGVLWDKPKLYILVSNNSFDLCSAWFNATLTLIVWSKRLMMYHKRDYFERNNTHSKSSRKSKMRNKRGAVNVKESICAPSLTRNCYLSLDSRFHPAIIQLFLFQTVVLVLVLGIIAAKNKGEWRDEIDTTKNKHSPQILTFQ